MIVFLRQRDSLLESLFPYLEASGEFSMAFFGEERIPMGELWIDACFDLFAAPDPAHIYGFFSEIQLVLEQWKAAKVRLVLSHPLESSEPFLKKNILLLEHMVSFLQKAYGVYTLTVPLLLEKHSAHPVSAIIQAVRARASLTLLWSSEASFRVMGAAHCAELFLAGFPDEACMLAGRLCTLGEIEKSALMLWGKACIVFEDAYAVEEKYQASAFLGEEEEPLDRMLFALIQ